MSNTPIAVEICCCGNCEQNGHDKVVERPLTAKELKQREEDAAKYAAEQAEKEANELAKVKALQSAQDKLRKLGLTAEEVTALF